jgi:hypothetical protein
MPTARVSAGDCRRGSVGGALHCHRASLGGAQATGRRSSQGVGRRCAGRSAVRFTRVGERFAPAGRGPTRRLGNGRASERQTAGGAPRLQRAPTCVWCWWWWWGGYPPASSLCGVCACVGVGGILACNMQLGHDYFPTCPPRHHPPLRGAWMERGKPRKPGQPNLKPTPHGEGLCVCARDDSDPTSRLTEGEQKWKEAVVPVLVCCGGWSICEMCSEQEGRKPSDNPNAFVKT